MGKLTVVAAAAAGYVLGTRAGRERYEQIKQNAQRVWNDPRVADKRHEAGAAASQKANEAAAAARQKATDAAAAAAAAAKHKAEEVVAEVRDSDVATSVEHEVKDAAAATPSNNEGADRRQPGPKQGI